MQAISKKTKRPISRKFWNYLKYLPAPIRTKIIRAQFEVNENLPEELTFKQAETPEEIRQALNLVHDSYVELNYMDPNESRLRLTKYLALPTTVILVVKWKEDVIGTVSIIPDSAFGLPSDTTWDLSRFRHGGKVIAEVASLAIKKDYRMRRGKLLLPLLKFFHHFSRDVLKLDAIVLATTLEVEYFYRDILLAEPVTEKTGQEHSLVKGNPSACCIRHFNAEMDEYAKKVYNSRSPKRNLYRFFYETQLKNMIFPDSYQSLQAYTRRKNNAQAEILKLHSSLLSDLSDSEKLVLKNLDIYNCLPLDFSVDRGNDRPDRKDARLEVRFSAWSFFATDQKPFECMVTNASKKGCQVHVKNQDRIMRMGEHFILSFAVGPTLIHCTAEVVWVRSDSRVGARIIKSTGDWEKLVDRMWQELREESNVVALEDFRRAN